MRNVLITGGCGFIGSNLAVSLAADGDSVVCFDNLSRRGSEILLRRILEHGCEFVHGDIRNREDFNKVKQECEVMIECSAEPSVLMGSQGSEAMFMVENNLFGAANCFEYCRTHNMSVIFLSTSRVYPYDVLNTLHYEERETRFEFADKWAGISTKGVDVEFPLEGLRSLYGATKLSGEHILREYSSNYGMHSIIDRCGVIAGPWQLARADQGVFTFWLLNHYFKDQLRYIGFGGKGKQVRDLLHVDDLATLIKLQLKSVSKFSGQVFNVGGGRLSNLSLLETTELCQQITGNKIHILSGHANRPADLLWYITDNRRSQEEFQWSVRRTPTEILSDTHDWISANDRSLKTILKGI